jgi:hypothetical protein
MEELRNVLGLNKREMFDVMDSDGQKISLGPYYFDDNNLILDKYGNTIGTHVLWELLLGTYNIEREPYKPREGDMYWTVNINGGIDFFYFHCNNEIDLMRLYMGNCFSVRKAAEEAKDVILEKFSAIKVDKKDTGNEGLCNE